MAVVVTLGYLGYGEYLGGKGDDLTFGKFDGIFKGDQTFPTISIWYVLPPLVLLFITRLGIPVSTTFLVLTFFAPKALPQMLVKSLGGYGVAFTFAIVAFMVLSRVTERLFLRHPLDGDDHGLWTNRSFWTALQWGSTGFLWSQWLTQDLVNIMVYLGDPREVTPEPLSLPWPCFCSCLGTFLPTGRKDSRDCSRQDEHPGHPFGHLHRFLLRPRVALVQIRHAGHRGEDSHEHDLGVFGHARGTGSRAAHATRGNASRRQEGGFHGVFRPWEGDHRSRGKRLARGLLVLRGRP